MRSATRLLLADDHRAYRRSLRALLDAEDGLHVVGEAEDGAEALRLVAKHVPDVVLMDVGIPVLNGIEATRQIRVGHPQVAVIAISMHTHRAFVDGMLEAGASGYLLKERAREQIAEALRTVAAGGTYVSPDLD